MATSDPRLIRLVAARYRELQGLATAFDVLLPLYVAAALVLPHDAAIVAGIVFLALTAVSLAWLRPRIQRSYASRFGRASGGHLHLNGVVIYLGLTMGPGLEGTVPPWVRVVVIFLMLGARPARIVIRDWPFRLHWLPCVAVAATAALQLGMGSVHDVTFQQRQAGWFLAASVALGMACLFDHALLVRTMTGSTGETAVSEPTAS